LITVHRKYRELFSGTDRFTAGTRRCLERTVGRALYGCKGDGYPLQRAVHRATRELQVQGLDGAAILAVLGAVVEQAGRSSGADRSSLLSGEPLWMLVQSRVLASAQRELAPST